MFMYIYLLFAIFYNREKCEFLSFENIYFLNMDKIPKMGLLFPIELINYFDRFLLNIIDFYIKESY